jgi:hypothetical protein
MVFSNNGVRFIYLFSFFPQKDMLFKTLKNISPVFAGFDFMFF